LIRLSLILQEFDLEIRHIKGKDNVIDDPLSRCDYIFIFLFST